MNHLSAQWTARNAQHARCYCCADSLTPSAFICAPRALAAAATAILKGMVAATPDVLIELLTSLHATDRALHDVALQGVTMNPAAALNLPAVGNLRESGRANLVLLTNDGGGVRSVMSGGRWLLRDGELL